MAGGGVGLRARDGAGDAGGSGESGWEAGCPLPENTVVSPLLCGVGFRLLPALISASSSELSPVGDIMLKDLVLFLCLRTLTSRDREERRDSKVRSGRELG